MSTPAPMTSAQEAVAVTSQKAEPLAQPGQRGRDGSHVVSTNAGP